MHDSHSTTLPDRYHFITPVWNQRYVELFLEYALPAQLASGNLTAVPAGRGLYQVFTRSQDVESIRQAASFRCLQEMMPVSIEVIDDLDLTRSYEAMSACYERGLSFSAGRDTAFFFVTPDQIWSEGSFQAVHARLQQGKRAVMAFTVRACLKEVTACLAGHRSNREPCSIPISPRDLVRLALEHLHPLSVAHLCRDGANFSLGHYYWRVGDHGLIARCFHIHPLMVRPVLQKRRLLTSLDHEFVRLTCPDYGQVHVVHDSDELCGIELSAREHLAEEVATTPVPDTELNTFVDRWTNSYHRWYFREGFCLHSEDITEDYREVRAESDQFVERVLRDFSRRTPAASQGMRAVAHCVDDERRSPLLWIKRKVRSACRRVYRAVNYKIYARIESLEAALRDARREHRTLVRNQAAALEAHLAEIRADVAAVKTELSNGQQAEARLVA